MVELIKLVEGFFRVVWRRQCMPKRRSPEWPCRSRYSPTSVNYSWLHRFTKCTAWRIPYRVARGHLAGPDEDHNPATAGRISEVLTARSDIPYAQRIEVARFMEDLTASYQAGWYSVISLHGGGSPEALKREIYRRYPVEERVALVERLLERGVSYASDPRWFGRQPGRCCLSGCQGAEPGLLNGKEKTAPCPASPLSISIKSIRAAPRRSSISIWPLPMASASRWSVPPDAANRRCCDCWLGWIIPRAAYCASATGRSMPCRRNDATSPWCFRITLCIPI